MSIFIIDPVTCQIQGLFLVKYHRNPIDLALVIRGFGFVKGQKMTNTRTALSSNSNSKRIFGTDALFVHQVLDFSCRLIRDIYYFQLEFFMS